MKTLTKNDVSNITIELLQNDMIVTNLDIKNEARKRGFFATQAIVAKFTNELDIDNVLEYFFNGKWRSYSLKDLSTSPQVNTNSIKSTSLKKSRANTKTSIQIDDATGIHQYTNLSGKSIIGYDTMNNHTYKVFSVDPLITDILYFDYNSNTRDQMRYAFKKLTSEKHYKNIRVNLI